MTSKETNVCPSFTTRTPGLLLIPSSPLSKTYKSWIDGSVDGAIEGTLEGTVDYATVKEPEE